MIGSRSTGYHGNSWGFNFDWQDVTRFSPAGLPTVVVSSFVANALLDLHGLTGQEDLLDLAKGVIEFIQSDLSVYEDRDGICFSYTPIDRHIVHNASMMGAALMARVSALTGREDLMDTAVRAVEFTVAKQEPDGSWAYSIDGSGRKRMQIDFHQGFILDSLLDFITYSGGPMPDTPMLCTGARYSTASDSSMSLDDPFGGSRELARGHPSSGPGILTFSRLSAMSELLDAH